MSNTTDLTKQAPASPRQKVGPYILLARAADKGRADLAGKVGEYHFNCPLDQMLFEFKGVKGEDVKEQLKAGATNEDLAKWLDTHGIPKTADEIKEWGAGVEAYRPYDNPEKKEWFVEQCANIGIDPATHTLFDWLEADDKLSYAK